MYIRVRAHCGFSIVCPPVKQFSTIYQVAKVSGMPEPLYVHTFFQSAPTRLHVEQSTEASPEHIDYYTCSHIVSYTCSHIVRTYDHERTVNAILCGTYKSDATAILLPCRRQVSGFIHPRKTSTPLAVLQCTAADQREKIAPEARACTYNMDLCRSTEECHFRVYFYSTNYKLCSTRTLTVHCSRYSVVLSPNKVHHK